MLETINSTWDIESIFPGGSQSKELQNYMEDLLEDLQDMSKELEGTVEDWPQVIDRVQNLGGRLREAASFIGCLNAQNVKDYQAKILTGQIQQIQAAYKSLLTTLNGHLLSIPQAEWEVLLEKMAPLAFQLEERRRLAEKEMDGPREKLVNDLSVDGYHGWWNLYSTITGRIRIPFVRKGKEENLSVGQAANLFSHPQAEIRHSMGERWEKAWSGEAELCAAALNHIAGFRLNLYRHRGWDSVLTEPLEMNRMSMETLESMWDTIEENKDIFVAFLQRKASLLDISSLTWYDLRAPLGEIEEELSFAEGADFVVRQFAQFSSEMARFAQKALEKRWVEAQDRPGKRAGAFCTSFPMSGETRVFMTYSGSKSSISTLAHELGHAFHQEVMQGLPLMAQRYAMNVAETASTFAENVVADAALQEATTKGEKVILLGEKIHKSISFFMDIHCRFLFEKELYERRSQGPLGVEELNSLMEKAQRKAFRDSLSVYHPTFWASKLHFFNTAVPFYNFPYTFGYLFSSGVYARAREEGKAFAPRYRSLLRDTGSMQVEDLARKHLDVDIRNKDFWQEGIDQAAKDVKEFLTLTQ